MPQKSPTCYALSFTNKPDACVTSSTYFEEYLWPFPVSEPPESSHFDAMTDIFGMPQDEDLSRADTCSPFSLEFSDVTSQPELTEYIADDEPGHTALAGVSTMCDLQPLTTTPQHAAQMDIAVDAVETGDRKIKRKAVLIAQDAQMASALEHKVRRKKPACGAARQDITREKRLLVFPDDDDDDVVRCFIEATLKHS